jgi:Flp pilus assembly protein TadD
MKARQAVVCPKCGALNRPTWEFCARCNESLEGAAAVAEGPTPDDADAEVVTGTPLSLGSVALLLALALGAGVAWRYAATAPPPARPDPAMFTIPTQPPQPQEAPPDTDAGAADYLEGRRLMNAGDLAGAVQRLAAAVAADPQNAEYHNVYGHALWRSGDRDAALSEHQEAARLDPRLSLQYARDLDVAGRSAEAAQAYEQILADNPDAATVREDLGRLLFRSGDYQRAAGYLQEAVRGRPDDPVLQQELAYSLDQAGNRALAESTYRQVLQDVPNAALTRGLLAENLLEQGHRDQALAVLREGLRLTPEAPILQRQLGSVLERSGRGAEAAAAYRAYARLAPNAPDVRDIEGRAARLEAAGRTQ